MFDENEEYNSLVGTKRTANIFLKTPLIIYITTANPPPPTPRGRNTNNCFPKPGSRSVTEATRTRGLKVAHTSTPTLTKESTRLRYDTAVP